MLPNSFLISHIIRFTGIYFTCKFFIFRSCHEKELLIDGQKPPQIDTVVVTNGKNGATKREMVGSESKEEIV